MLTLDARKPVFYQVVPVRELTDEIKPYINTNVVGIHQGQPVFLIRTHEPFDGAITISREQIKEMFKIGVQEDE